jgi:hypothetical protein
VVKLTSQVIKASDAVELARRAVNLVLFAADTIASNGIYFLGTADILFGSTGLDAPNLAHLLRGWAEGEVVTLPGGATFVADGLEYLARNVNLSSIIAGVTSPAALVRQATEFIFLEQSILHLLADKDQKTSPYNIAQFLLNQDAPKFNFCSRVAGRDHFIYRKRA